MVERLAVELDDIGVSTLVVGMAMIAFAISGLRLKPVKSATRQAVDGGILVACEAKAGLRASRERQVTVVALLLEFGVARDQRSGDDEPLEQVLRARRPHCGAGNGEPD